MLGASAQMTAVRASELVRARVLTPASVMQLQKTAGNAAVVSLLRPPTIRRASTRPQEQASVPIAEVVGRTPAATQRATVANAEAPPQTTEAEDVDTSEFTDEPQKAAAKLAAMPAPVKATPPPAPVGPKPGPLPPGPKSPALKKVVAPPKRGSKVGQKPAPKTIGEVIRKPVPPLPPTYRYEPGDLPPPPSAVVPLRPSDDPAFNTVVRAAKKTVKAARKHPSGKDESAAAQGAAQPPGNDELSQAKANRADTMAMAKPKEFDEDAFASAVEQAIAKTAPKNLSEAGDVDEKSRGVKDVIGTTVAAGKEVAAGDVVAKAKEPPNLSTAVTKPVTDMKPLEIAEPSGTKASAAMPAPAPSEQLDLRNGPAQVDQEMADTEITEKQLAESNEPEFVDALEAKKAGEEHSKKAPAEVRKKEAAILGMAAVHSATAEKNAVGGAKGAIGKAVANVGGQKNVTKSKDELKRKEVADAINSIFDKTKVDVEGILGRLDEKVDTLFTTGEATIRESFTRDWKIRLDDYKDRRYSGFWGWKRWARDKIRGLPSEANKLFEISRKLYEQGMKTLVRRISQAVAAELKNATSRIEQGRKEVATYVGSLKGAIATFGQEAAADIADKFNDLDSSVKDTFDDLSNSLAKKCDESRNAVNEEITKAQEANKGLIDKAIGFVTGVKRVIGQLKDLILTVFQKIASVIGDIIAHPIRFLQNFVSTVKDGVQRFASKIGDHLQQGLMDWLLDSVGKKGLEIPKSFDLMGMLKLVLSVLSLTSTTVLERLAKKVGGEKGVAALAQGSDIVRKLIAEGPAGLWEMLLEKFSDFEDMVLGKIKEYVTKEIVYAGIGFLVTMLNPASAFIKACQMIYKIVMFIVEKGSQIKEFVETVIDAAGDIARGVTDGVAEKIESCLARLLPLAIGLLANILNLGGVGDKIKSIIERVRNPILKALDGVLNTVAKLTAPIWKAAKKGLDKLRGGDDTPQGKQKRLDAGLAAAQAAANRFAGRTVMGKVLKPLLFVIKKRYGLTRLHAVENGEYWAVEGEINPGGRKDTKAKVAKVDSKKVLVVAASAKGELKRADAEYNKVKAQAPRTTIACGGGEMRQQGGGSLDDAQRDPDAAKRWLEADAARWGALKAVTGGHLDEMTRLTPEAERKRRRLRDKESIEALLRKTSSYRYPGRTKEQRAEHFERTGEYLPRRSFQDRGAGATSVVHAEKLLRQNTSAQAIGVSRKQCDDCVVWFRAQARAANDFIVVADPFKVRVFMPDGNMRSPDDFR